MAVVPAAAKPWEYLGPNSEQAITSPDQEEWMRSAANMRTWARLRPGVCVAIILGLVLSIGPFAPRVSGSDPEDVEIAINLARLLQAGRSVISANQALINDPNRGDKGLTGDVVLAAAIEKYTKLTGANPQSTDPASRKGRLLRAEMASIKEVMDENQSLINEQGSGFKGFIPATFARLVTERLQKKVGNEAEIKVTAPPALVRNRKSRPDDWEKSVIESKFLSLSWPHGQLFWQVEPNKGREAIRVMVPEYYATSCLSCHGPKKGEIDITGYPKEGASEGDLGGVISITLFRPNG
jgi:hypothetical protein